MNSHKHFHVLRDSAGEADPGGGGSSGVPASTGSAPASTGVSASTIDAFVWGDGWRDQLAMGSTDSEKERKQLERYESPDQIWRKARELERKLSGGELKTAKPEGGSAEEIARWRAENAVPAAATDYKIDLPNGVTPPKEDDPFLQAFLKSAHEADYTQAHVDAALSSFYAEVGRQSGLMEESEREAEAKTDDELHQRWGADYRLNKNMAEALLGRAPEGFRDKFMNGHLDDGSPIKASTQAWEWLVQMEREINPAATVVPGAGGDIGANIAAEIAKYKEQMPNPNSPYHKGDGTMTAEQHQERYRNLIVAQQKVEEKKG